MPKLESYMDSHGKDDYYEVALEILVRSGVDMYAYLIEDIKWYEIDNIIDLKNASLMFSKQ